MYTSSKEVDNYKTQLKETEQFSIYYAFQLGPWSKKLTGRELKYGYCRSRSAHLQIVLNKILASSFERLKVGWL